MADRLITLITVVLAGLYFFGISNIRVPSIGDALGPKAFPMLIGVGLIFSAILLVLESLKQKKAQEQLESENTISVDTSAEVNYFVLTCVTIITMIYFASFEVAGYILATAIYLIVLTWFFNKKSRYIAIISSISFTFVTYFGFTYLLGIRLPRGFLPL